MVHIIPYVRTAEPAETHSDWPPHTPHCHYTPAAGVQHRALNIYPGTTKIKQTKLHTKYTKQRIIHSMNYELLNS